MQDDGFSIDFGKDKRRGFCPIEHVSDHPELCSSLFKTVAVVGMKLKNVLVLSSRAPGKKGGMCLVSLKPELIHRAKLGEFPTVLEQVCSSSSYSSSPLLCRKA